MYHKETAWGYELDLSGPEQRPVASSCEHNNEPLGSIKRGKYRDKLVSYQFLNENSNAWSQMFHMMDEYELRISDNKG